MCLSLLVFGHSCLAGLREKVSRLGGARRGGWRCGAAGACGGRAFAPRGCGPVAAGLVQQSSEDCFSSVSTPAPAIILPPVTCLPVVQRDRRMQVHRSQRRKPPLRLQRSIPQLATAMQVCCTWPSTVVVEPSLTGSFHLISYSGGESGM